MRQQIMNGLRKAGEGIRSIDDAYSAKLLKRVDSIAEGIEAKGSPNAAQIMGITGAGMLSQPSLRKYSEIGKDGTPNDVPAWAAYGIPAASATAKYVMPAAGVTLAGKGLIDLASQIGQQTQSAIMPE